MLRVVRTMSAEGALRRLRVVGSALGQQVGQHDKYAFISIRLASNNAGDKVVSIGDVSKELVPPRNPELVPQKFLPGGQVPQSLMRHLRWIMQKDLLGQDVFLIGPPGPLRRSIAMMYLELTKKEAEYISLSRDTTETDLKQRREIRAGTAFHIDQCAVRAATEGRILVLEGIEKAERNVLPVLNNLLENREMQLDDGRFLMAADRYDKLLGEHSKEELDSWKIVRVDESFRVIALGLPVPRYQGNPLDPPLRSRFQARDIHPLPFKDQLELLNAMGAGVSPDKVSQLLSFASTLKSDEASTLGLPDFPLDNLHALIQILNAVPSVSPQRLLEKLYPHEVMLNKEGRTAVVDALKSFELQQENLPATDSLITEVRKSGERATVQLQVNREQHSFEVPAGVLQPGFSTSEFVSTAYHDQLLAEMVQAHMVKDFCVIGPRGCGKSVLVKQFSDMLGYHMEPIMLYQDMTARDLLQQRTTLPNGDTSWRPSPLVTAALEGSLAILDGVHRVNAGSFAVLHRLIHDRELSLFDGTRLLRHDRYDEIKETEKLTDEEMAERSIQRIHPSFRVLALSEPPDVGSSSKQWLNAELLTAFLYHNMRPLSRREELSVLNKMVPHMGNMQTVLDLTHKMRQSADTNLKSVASSLSTRQLLRIARRMAKYPGENSYDTIQKACLGRFLPRLTKTALEEELEEFGITKPEQTMVNVEGVERAITCEVKDNVLRIGNTQVDVYNPENKMKVPDILFYENAQHLTIMEDMLKDYLLGEHLLLVGNQGVGKNKIVDRFLYLLNRPREYLQLHRDTTVQTLTLQPTVQDGVIVYEDSPLVRSVKNGHILVVDEADKAPTNVTCILKTLVESGEMHLADGRRIVSAHSGMQPSSRVIVAHPDFRMIVLANRPGFPFLGNDFFGAMGDIFSCFAVDNPDMESEMSMLRQYGPNVPENILRKLVLAFSELRDMADQGLINYPYSTREVVNMVKHLEKYPTEGLATVVRNVFDFDTYNKELTETIIGTLHKHGVPVGADPRNISLAKEFNLPKFELSGEWNFEKRGGGSTLPVEDRKLRIKGPMRLFVQTAALERTEARAVFFTEQEAFWTLPMHETCGIADVAVTKGTSRQPGQVNDDIIHIATVNPVSMYTMNPRSQHLTFVDLYDFFPTNRMGFRPRIHLASLGFPLDTNVIVHEETLNIILNVNWENGEITRLDTTSLLEATADKITRNFRQHQGQFKMCSQFCHESDGLLLFYKQDSHSIDVVNMLEGRCHSVSLPVGINNLSMVSRYDWLVTETDTERKYLVSNTKERPFDYTLQIIDECMDDTECMSGGVEMAAPQPLHDALLSGALGQQIKSPNRVLSSKDCYAAIAVGLPELSAVEIYTCERPEAMEERLRDNFSSVLTNQKGRMRARAPVEYMPDSGLVIRAMPTWQVPKSVKPEEVSSKHVSAYLELTDVVNKKLRYLPVPGVTNTSSYAQWYSSGSEVNLVMAGMSNDGLVTVDAGGCVRLWETAIYFLQQSMEQWRGLIGDGDSKPLEISFDKELKRQAEIGAPKHGRIDPTGAPHVGGNQWAGGTGGTTTAGMGGMGGPYRLDMGNEVFQISQWDKDSLPEDVRRAAREMGLKAWKERLKQIRMSEYDGEMYDKFAKNVARQVKSLRVILDSLQAKGKERQWLKNQTYGDLDEARLIEGLTGEKAIYKRRGEKEPELGTPQQKPKLLRLLCDVSGSMYRFDGYDGRLQREMEAMLMVMEAFSNYEEKIKFEIIGHSGEGHKFDIVKADKPPKNNKDRLNTLKELHAHSQFCISGDNTLEATQHAIRTIVDEEADEHFVIVLSDANLERYDIRPKALSDILTSNEDVNSYVIFIGSLGDQANRLIKQMPSGRAFLCMDTKNLPMILQQIFTSTMLSTR